MSDDLFFSCDCQLSNVVDYAARLRDYEDFYTATPEVKKLINEGYLEPKNPSSKVERLKG